MSSINYVPMTLAKQKTKEIRGTNIKKLQEHHLKVLMSI